MSKLSISLTPKYRLDFKLVKQRRVRQAERLFPKIKELRRVRRGSKISRFFRHIFQHSKMRRILGTNLAVALIAGSFLPQTLANNVDVEDKVISVNKVSLITERDISYPLEKAEINQGYHLFHPGIDLEGEIGDSVGSIMKGVVTGISYSRYAYGNAVLIDHGGELTSLYAHLSIIEVSEGQNVVTEEKIGEVGSTGFSTGSHLHLEIRENGVPVNPLSILPSLNQQ